MITDDYVVILSDGSRLAGEELAKALADVEIKEYSLSDVHLVTMNPDAAVLMYRIKYEAVVDGVRSKELQQASAGWVRRGGKWLSCFYQETPIRK